MGTIVHVSPLFYEKRLIPCSIWSGLSRFYKIGAIYTCFYSFPKAFIIMNSFFCRHFNSTAIVKAAIGT
jgi:hypothetical protein